MTHFPVDLEDTNCKFEFHLSIFRKQEITNNIPWLEIHCSPLWTFMQSVCTDAHNMWYTRIDTAHAGMDNVTFSIICPSFYSYVCVSIYPIVHDVPMVLLHLHSLSIKTHIYMLRTRTAESETEWSTI